jgi:hypothetical protein
MLGHPIPSWHKHQCGLMALPNPNSTHKVYKLETLSQETTISNSYFVLWSLSNVPLRSSATILLNKRTCWACGQPQRIRMDLVLRIDFVSESNSNRIAKMTWLAKFWKIILKNTLPHQEKYAYPWPFACEDGNFHHKRLSFYDQIFIFVITYKWRSFSLIINDENKNIVTEH